MRDDVDFDAAQLIDPLRTAYLWDVGAEGFSAAVAVDTDGSETLWLVNLPVLGAPGADHGNRTPAHEQVGVLPITTLRRVWDRCGRPTKAGKPCQNRTMLGTACYHHKTAQ